MCRYAPISIFGKRSIDVFSIELQDRALQQSMLHTIFQDLQLWSQRLDMANLTTCGNVHVLVMRLYTPKLQSSKQYLLHTTVDLARGTRGQHSLIHLGVSERSNQTVAVLKSWRFQHLQVHAIPLYGPYRSSMPTPSQEPAMRRPATITLVDC